MPVNSSSFDDLLPPLHYFSNSSSQPLFECFRSRTSIYIFSALSIISILFLPVSILVLYLGYQQWRKQRSTTTTMSHSDIFTYHSMVMQMNEFLGFITFFWGGYIRLPGMMFAGLSVLSVTSLGQVLFHLLTCVERYLAVVHPITYLGLKQAGGVRTRNICIGCVWFLSCGWTAVWHLARFDFTSTFYSSLMVFLLIVVSFCSISVLCALKRPRSGNMGGNRFDKLKQRAFHNIMGILGVLLFRFVGNLIGEAVLSMPMMTIMDACAMLLFPFWFGMPSSLMLPLLFLHRAGKLQCCKLNNE